MMKRKNKTLCCYGTSLVGTSHIKKGTVCQDAHKMSKLMNGWIVAAIADGVGSAIHSEIASDIAVSTVIEILSERIADSNKIEDALSLLPEAYSEAENRIEKFADEKGDKITDYDTTLSVVVYDGCNIVYGHSGDGGIVGLTNEGLYIPITKPQKADDGVCVIPLRAGEKYWVFGKTDGSYASVLLATDGVYDTFFPYLLKGQANEVYVPLIRYFLDNNWLDVNDESIASVGESRIEFLKSNAYDSITDDKTIVVLINPLIKPSFQDDDYYAEPDWDKLQLEWNKKAYPHMYSDKKESKEENDNA